MSRVLLVDDEKELCQLLASLLELNGHWVECAYSGHEAMALLTKEHFDIVVSDIRMPLGSGIELGEWMYQHRKRLPLIFISGAPGRELELPPLLTKIPCLRKPLDHVELLEQIEQSLGGAGQGRSLYPGE